MSDLQCPATLLIVRHAEAEYDDELLSDRGGSLTLRGRDQARALADTLTDQRVSVVYCSGMSRAVQTAEIVAARLGVVVRVRDDLREWSVGEPEDEVVDWMAGELEGIADQHRGETVLVVSHGGVVSLAVPHLAVNIGADHVAGRPLENCGLVRVLADADGFVVRSWGNEAIGANQGKMRDSDGVLW